MYDKITTIQIKGKEIDRDLTASTCFIFGRLGIILENGIWNKLSFC